MRIRSRCLIAVLAVTTVAGLVAAQEVPPPVTPPPSRPPAPTPDPKPPEPPLPSLDDLLGLPAEKEPGPGAKPRPPAADPTRSELERKLSAMEAAEQFKVAIDLMGDTADRLQTSRDTGLATQRIQEDILRKLDQLIKSAEENQQQMRSSRSQSQRDQQQQQPNQQQSQQQRNPAGNEAADDMIDPPARQAEQLNPGAAARGAAWGGLPERLRGALLQGDADKYSAWYRQWTESYYKRLAEDANK